MKITRRPNPQLKQIVLEETNDGRDVVRYLKSTFMQVEDGVSLFGLRHKDYARSHKIAAARILARIGLEEGKRYLRRNYVRTPFRRVHPEDEDGPKRDMAASTAELYRLVKKETNDGRDIIIRFVGIMKGYYPEYKPHLRMAAAKELIRQIEFDYEEEPTSPAPTHTESAPATEPVGASLVGARADSEITTHQPSQTDHSSDNDSISNSELKIENSPSLADIQRQMHIQDGSVHYRDYAARHAKEAESIYQSIIRRASYRRNLQDAKREAEELIGQFDLFMEERDPEYRPVAVPDNLITTSLTQQMDETRTYPFDPADYYDLDQDYFYYCLCNDCDDCDELHYFFEFMRELEEEYEDP